MAAGLSLHIGLNKVDPEQYDGWDGELVACENDAADMARLARAAGFADTTLLTADGTVENVTAALRLAGDKLAGGDVLLFTYSGHGGQVPDVAGPDEEPDALDETLVLYDRQYLDDELHAEFRRLQPGVRIVALLDCCHSGSGIEVRDILSPEAMEAQFRTRDPALVEGASRLMPVHRQEEIFARDRTFFEELQRELAGGADDGLPEPPAVLISACQDNQLAADGPVNGKFTETLLKVWDDGAFRGGYRSFHRAVQRLMPATQSPNLYTTGSPSPEFLRQRPFTI